MRTATYPRRGTDDPAPNKRWRRRQDDGYAIYCPYCGVGLDTNYGRLVIVFMRDHEDCRNEEVIIAD